MLTIDMYQIKPICAAWQEFVEGSVEQVVYHHKVVGNLTEIRLR